MLPSPFAVPATPQPASIPTSGLPTPATSSRPSSLPTPSATKQVHFDLVPRPPSNSQPLPTPGSLPARSACRPSPSPPSPGLPPSPPASASRVPAVTPPSPSLPNGLLPTASTVPSEPSSSHPEAHRLDVPPSSSLPEVRSQERDGTTFVLLDLSGPSLSPRPSPRAPSPGALVHPTVRLDVDPFVASRLPPVPVYALRPPPQVRLNPVIAQALPSPSCRTSISRLQVWDGASRPFQLKRKYCTAPSAPPPGFPHDLVYISLEPLPRRRRVHGPGSRPAASPHLAR